MSLRVKLLLLFTVAIAAAAGFTAWSAERYAEHQFQQADQQRSNALAAQFRDELAEREAEVTTSIQTIADAESTVRMVLDLSRSGSDPSVYAGDARGLAASHQLDFLELATADGTLISSAQWPSHVGSKELWLTHENDWNQRGAFLDRVELPDRVDMGLIAVRMVHAGTLNLYIVGGHRLDAGFLRTLSLPEGMRALLYRNLATDFAPANLSDGQGAVADAESFEPLLESMQKQPVNLDADGPAPSVSWSADSGSAERFVAVPLTGKQGEFLGALLLGSPQAALVAMKNYVAGSALMAAAGGLVLAFLLSWWIAGRVSRPLARLTEGLGEVASGDWDARVEGSAVPEVLQAIGIFNKMTRQLTDERAGQVARERAAAWRQLAGQLAAELKMLLPPLQTAVEGLAQASQLDNETDTPEPDEFSDDDASALDANGSAGRSADADRLEPLSSAMRQTLETLAACAGKLGEFASLPVPRLEPVNLNETVRAAVQAFEPRFSAIGRPPITPELFLDDRVGPLRADPVLLRKAIDNLLLFVLEDMPAGGTFTIHTRHQDNMAHMILSGSGSGFSASRGPQQDPQNRESRTAMPDSATRVSGIGLSLATVQSIVSSHGGRISIESSPLAGTTFYLDWPVHGNAPPSSIPTFPAVLQNQSPASRKEAPQESVAGPAEEAQPDAQPAEPAAVEPVAEQPAKFDAQAEATPAPSATEQHADTAGEAPAQANIELTLEPQPAPAAAPEPRPEQPQFESLPESTSPLHTEPQSEPEPVAAESVTAPVEKTLVPLVPQAALAEMSLSVPEAKLEAEPQAPADLPAEIFAEPRIQTEAAPAPQPEMQLSDGAAEPEPAARELAAVIEEVIETPRRSIFRNAQHFAHEADYVEESGEPENADFPIKETALGEIPGNLFGVPVPDLAGDATAAPTTAASVGAAPTAPAFTLAEAESHLRSKPAASQDAQQNPSKGPQEQNGKRRNDPTRPLTYSPLTYRG